ncbi:hypothetical protein IDJ77_09315 [Mucilaginibacter sp. ZT4R22]|uniref:PH (Pleckstrin Homology) domain-containing protein n=1 Tax=Mucilaginibacter pankratovii TaxID=2772110 RepID=A0ABR7WNW1_9SPHI|nr:hypothetical protein [Mucilaginibacter pankratovii]MBD1364006.1 hypothetical protein [Mucilaginibacter pankratovii]
MWWYKETNPDYEQIHGIMLKIMIPIIIPLIAFIVWASYPWLSRDEMLIKDSPLLVIHGKVDSIYNDEDNHNIKTYRLTNRHTYFLQESTSIKVNLGDSLSKLKGSEKVYIVKAGGEKITVDYKDLMLELAN